MKKIQKIEKKDLEKKVILGARNFGISSVLFRNAVGSHLGVNVTDMECLGLLFHKGFSTPSELAEHTGLSSGATTAMIDRLEKANLIERQPNPNDRRGYLIVIVPETAKKIGPLFQSIRTKQGALVASYSEKELNLIANFFDKFNSFWESEREKLVKKLQSKTTV